MKKIYRIFTLLALITFSLTLAACDYEGRQDPIQLAGGNWESIEVHNAIAGFILEHGYDTPYESTALDVTAMVTAMSSGSLDVNIEMWRENIPSYRDDIEEGLYHEINVNFIDPGQGIWIPQYLQDDYGIYTIQDLEGHHELFEHPEAEEGKGIVFGGPEGWLVTDFLHTKFNNEDDYPFLVEHFDFYSVGSVPTLNTTLQNAYEDEKPWAGYHWAPTWPHAVMDLVRLDDDLEYDLELHDTHAHGNLPAGDVVVAVRDGFEDDHPELFDFFSNYSTSEEITSEILNYLQANEDADIEDAAMWFFSEYEDLWTEWVPEDVADRVRDALNNQ